MHNKELLETFMHPDILCEMCRIERAREETNNAYISLWEILKPHKRWYDRHEHWTYTYMWAKVRIAALTMYNNIMDYATSKDTPHTCTMESTMQVHEQVKSRYRIVRCVNKNNKFIGARVETSAFGDWQFVSGHISMESASAQIDRLNKMHNIPAIAEIVIRKYENH